jgi:oxygen-independent coproporphyrinogen-3 oxidase
MAIERLAAAGYVHIGMDHFARPHDELARAAAQRTLQRDFQGYSARGRHDLIGLGVSAIGSIGDAYAQNHKHLSAYYRAVDQNRLPIERGLILSMDDRIRRDVIHDIMCHGAVDRAAISERYAMHFDTYFARELLDLVALAQDGLVEIGGIIRVTPTGRFLLRNIAMVFDAYLRGGQAPAYSKAV